MHRVPTGNGIVLQEMIEQAGQRGQFAPDRGPGQAPSFQLGTPCQYMCASNSTELIGAGEADKAAEVFQVILIGTSGTWVVDIGKPLDCSWHTGQLLELSGS